MTEPRLSRAERRLPRAEPRVLLVDNDDSFTHNVAHAIREAGARCEVVGNDLDLETLRAARPDGLAIGPGPCTPHEAGHTLAILRAALAEPFPPVLGICLGHQALALRDGARVYLGPARRGVEDVEPVGAHPLFAGLGPRIAFGTDHTEGVALPPRYQLLARSAAYPVEAMGDDARRRYGVQFHPEISGELGQRLIARFVALAGRRDLSDSE